MLIPYFLSNLGMGGGAGSIYATSPFAASVESCSASPPPPPSAMFSWAAVQGQGTAFRLKAVSCSVDAATALVGTISTGGTDAAVATFTPTWSATGPPDLSGSLTAVQTAALAPGAYVVQVGLADGSGAIAYGLLTVAAAPANAPSYDLLATPAFVLSQCPEVAANPAKVAALPAMLLKATQVIRRHCNRTFTRRVFTEYLDPSLEGEVMLQEMPINRVARVSRNLKTAVEIKADPSVFQVAYVDFETADAASPNPFDVSYTGITLVGSAAGVASSHTILFSTLTTMSDLIAAVDAFSGWTATTGGGSYGDWPIGELYCDGTSQGALGDGVQLRVFADDVSASRLDRRTGLLTLPRGSYGDPFGPRWGPDWAAWNDYGVAASDSPVRVTYDAGYTTVPPVVQQAAVEIVKVGFNRLDLDYALKRESIGEYSYEFRDNFNLSIPDPVRQDLAPFVIHRA